jgi:hypothetical protein
MEGMGQRIDGGFYISAARPGKPGLSFPAAKRRPDFVGREPVDEKAENRALRVGDANLNFSS